MAKSIVIIAAVFLLSKAQAFTLSVSNGAFFTNNDVRINVADNCQNSGYTASGLLSLAVEASEQFWNKVPTSRLRLKQGGVVSVAGAFRTASICSSDNPCVPNGSLIHTQEILISCNVNATNFPSTSIIALTVPNNVTGQTINASTLLLNDNTNNQFASKSRPEQISILAHEIGHALGLGHSPVKDSLMYFQSRATSFRLGWDDIDGITYLYPVEQPISGCGSVDLDQSGNSKMGPMIYGFLFALLLGLALRKRPLSGLFSGIRSRK
ncbi:MAG: hypothetical protein CME70_23180 [Halobacteriovorax sp.]|nr:hypothetical protein [Halobacteriovorax sp.]|tara:strand:- start:72839 stop:73639 length:801 start_codon:yes stop_codon:yes gene_type:complete